MGSEHMPHTLSGRSPALVDESRSRLLDIRPFISKLLQEFDMKPTSQQVWTGTHDGFRAVSLLEINLRERSGTQTHAGKRAVSLKRNCHETKPFQFHQLTVSD